MSRRKEIKVGVRPVRAAAREFIAVCEAIEKGERPALVERIDFEDLMTFARVLTPRRLELLRALHAGGKMTARALAHKLNRDPKHVEADIQRLVRTGLIETRRGHVQVPWETVTLSAQIGAKSVRRAA